MPFDKLWIHEKNTDCFAARVFVFQSVMESFVITDVCIQAT